MGNPASGWRASPAEQPADVVVIGGGFFGCMVALVARDSFPRVVLLEREPALLQRASFVNQARVHSGYHYPRSLLTGLRSSVNFPRFVAEFTDCVEGSMQTCYAIARAQSKVTAGQFETYCRRIGVPLAPAPDSLRRLFSADLIEAVFEARECVFDAERLRASLTERLRTRGVELRTGTEATRVERMEEGVVVHARPGPAGATTAIPARFAFNCAYANINGLLAASGVPPVTLRHELAELALVEVPDALRGRAITVMCGPFFSLLPFPPRRAHTLSHVRYTPHGAWEDRGAVRYQGALAPDRFETVSAFPAMIADARRYLPVLGECRQAGSLWEIKTVLPQSESDDSRPILFKRSPELPGLVSVLGAKIDNVYDLPREMQSLFGAAA